MQWDKKSVRRFVRLSHGGLEAGKEAFARYSFSSRRILAATEPSGLRSSFNRDERTRAALFL